MSKLKISFEFFPPKTPEGLHNLSQSAEVLSTVSPDFFSVTFGAGGSTRAGTLDAVKMLQAISSVPVAPHLACIGLKQEDIRQLLIDYKKLGVKRIIALRGDMPSGMGQAGELRYASELVEFIRETTKDYFHIEVAAYPEFHPQATGAFDDVNYLKKKVEAGASSAITQYFFNPDAYFYFVDQCASQGIFMPIVPGIMPVTQFCKLMRFSEVCGAEIPRWMRKRFESYGDDLESIKQFGLEVVYNLCERLIDAGVPGLHFYTLNHAESCMALLNKLGIGAKKSIAQTQQVFA